ncbi:methyltransferase domain-containing protein [Candidatus Parabeggiatoa sp. HSG14]|uniref:class I SAM-dependent methyltransferase n=1 Tax=Candidatus Parabeggiatoa sp. HSG14 TaxID=3055593 RepID=UPI0025A76EA6|nr:methyltransferase domain-containing protein [Thiotrichales bacterium HSG14]
MAFWFENKDTEEEIQVVGPMDPHGLALLEHIRTGQAQWFDYFYHGSKVPSMTLCSSMYLEPSDAQIEVVKRTVALCRGKILDIGAGGGFAALILQDSGMDVTALDISTYCVKAMESIGVNNCVIGDIREYKESKYDTLILLDSVLGCAGSIEGISILLKHLSTLLLDGGQILLHDGMVESGVRVFEWSGYFQYKHYLGESFQWCNISADKLTEIAGQIGLDVTLPYEDDIEGRYLARLVFS